MSGVKEGFSEWRVDSAHSEFWFHVECDSCGYYHEGWESVNEDWSYEHECPVDEDE